MFVIDSVLKTNSRTYRKKILDGVKNRKLS